MNLAKIILRTDYTNKDGTNSVYLRLYIDRKKKDFSLKINVVPELWNEKTSRVKPKHLHAITINLLIDKNLHKANEIIMQSNLFNTVLTFEQFERDFINTGNKKDFILYAETYINDNKHRYAKETYKAYQSRINNIKEYTKTLTIKECNTEKFLLEYEKYMIETKQKAINSIYKELTFIKTILNVAQQNGLIEKNIFENYKRKTVETHREHLSASELTSLENLLNSNTLKASEMRVLEYFLFSCYTGLRFGDVKDLKYKNIILKDVEQNGKVVQREFLSVLMHKTKNTTGRTVEIPLIQKAKTIIGTGLPEQKIFNAITAQPTNRYVKEIIKHAGITKEISYHCSRHTFATHSLTLGIPIEVVSKLLGHSDLKTTQIYGKIVDASKVNNMDKWE